MAPHTVWVETLVPEGVLRADRLVRVYLRRGCNLGLDEPDSDDVSDVSFCAEVDPVSGPLMLGCTDDLDTAREQLRELLDVLAGAADTAGGAAAYVVRADGGPGRPWWTVTSRLPP